MATNAGGVFIYLFIFLYIYLFIKKQLRDIARPWKKTGKLFNWPYLSGMVKWLRSKGRLTNQNSRNTL